MSMVFVMSHAFACRSPLRWLLAPASSLPGARPLWASIHIPVLLGSEWIQARPFSAFALSQCRNNPRSGRLDVVVSSSLASLSAEPDLRFRTASIPSVRRRQRSTHSRHPYGLEWLLCSRCFGRARCSRTVAPAHAFVPACRKTFYYTRGSKAG